MSRLKEIPARLVKRRRHAGLSQDELGKLLGTTKSLVCKFEAQRITPSFNFVLATEAIFGMTLREAFPESFSQVHQEVVRRAAELDLVLQAKPSEESERKRRFLRRIQSRDFAASDAIV